MGTIFTFLIDADKTQKKIVVCRSKSSLELDSSRSIDTIHFQSYFTHMHQVLPKNNYLLKYTDISRLWILIQVIPKHINLRSILPYMESKPAMMLKYTFMYFMFWCMYEKHVQKILPLWPNACPKLHLWHSHTRLDLLRIRWKSARSYPSAFPSHHLLILQTTHQVRTLEYDELTKVTKKKKLVKRTCIWGNIKLPQ
jgi:hypothetical protein